MNLLSKAVRILTVPPFIGLLMLLFLYRYDPSLLGSAGQFWAAVFFLTFLPLLAYPLQPFFPRYKDRGREGQRSLAMLMSFGGYVCGIIYAFFSSATFTLWLIYSTYLLSGFCLILVNKVFHVKASGHACGVAGPIVMMIYLLGPQGLWGLLLYIAAFFSSIVRKRHTVVQFLLGSMISPFAMGISLLFFHFFIAF